MAIVRLDKVLAGANGNIESVIVYTNEETATLKKDFTNGLFVNLGEVNAEGAGREVHEAYPTAKDGEAEALLVANPELSYDESVALDEYENRQGQAVRAYRLYDGDVITFTEDLLPDGVAVGDVLAPGENGELETAAAGDYRYVLEVFEDAGYELHLDPLDISNSKKAFAMKVKRDYTVGA